MNVTRTLLAASMCAASLTLMACHDNDRMDNRDHMNRDGRMSNMDKDRKWDNKNAMMDKPMMVSMNELPPAAQSGLRREAMGGQVMNTSWHSHDGMKMYCGETMMDGQTYKITVDENGKLVMKGRADMMDKMKMEMKRMHGDMDNMNRDMNNTRDNMNRDMNGNMR